MIPLSILDLSVVTTGTKPAAALRNSIDLAREADALGYSATGWPNIITSPRWRAPRPI